MFEESVEYYCFIIQRNLPYLLTSRIVFHHLSASFPIGIYTTRDLQQTRIVLRTVLSTTPDYMLGNLAG